MLRLAGTNGAHGGQVSVKRDRMAPRGSATPRGIGDAVRATALFAAFAASYALAPNGASAQDTVYIGGGSASVTVDMGVLDALGPPPTVPELLLPTVPQPEWATPLRFPSQPPAFPAAASSGHPVVLVPPPQTNKPTQSVAAPQIAVPAAPMLPPAPPPTPEIVATMPVTIEPTPGVATVEEGIVTVEETVEVTVPVAPPPPPPPEPEIAAPTMPLVPSAVPTAPAAPTPPALPVFTETPVPAPPAPQTATVDPMAGATDQEGAARLLFERDGMALSDAAKAVIRDVAEQLNADDTKRLQLLAYARSAADDTSKARRLSLSRALAVRSELIALGVRSTRIDVRALGNKTDGGPADRVDLILADR